MSRDVLGARWRPKTMCCKEGQYVLEPEEVGANGAGEPPHSSLAAHSGTRGGDTGSLRRESKRGSIDGRYRCSFAPVELYPPDGSVANSNWE